nr:3-deoxy-D-manno-octulosonic acid transferase [Chitinophagaceae bacterium]
MDSIGRNRFVGQKHNLSLLLYRIFLAIYHNSIRIASLWNLKAALWRKGRKQFPSVVYSANTHDVVWMHCASLGEFEQGRPLLEKIKINYPSCKIVVTFFSPSGYQIIKNFKGADHIFYLPADSAVNAKKFIAEIKPALVLWIKYEYWFYYLNELKRKNIPTLLISGIYRSNMPFFKWYGVLWKKVLNNFTHFFLQNNQSKKILEKAVTADKITVSGDTRFDRVITIAEEFEPLPQIEKFCGNSQVIIAGSTWEDDEAEWVHYAKVHPEIKFIIAPHEIDKENLADVKKQFSKSIFYSEWAANRQPATGNEFEINCLIIDNIGMLSRLYKYATICYVGGGFGDDGLHNILEAAVYG